MASTSPSAGFLKRFLGLSKVEKGDIELPHQSKKKDKRLKSKMDTMKEGYSIFKNLGKKDASK